MTRIVTWNVNSINARAPIVGRWVKTGKPAVLLLQETKCTDEMFPRKKFEALGFNVETVGQKGRSGVAILSRLPLEITCRLLPGDMADAQARYIEALVQIPAKGRSRPSAIRVASIYVPNGNPAGSENFIYKLNWMRRLVGHVRGLLRSKEPLLLGGDFNVAPTDADLYNPLLWGNDALCRPETRARFRNLLRLGLTDAIAAHHPEPGNYTFWDYQGNAWAKNNGWRIDHLLLSPPAMNRLVECGVDRKERGKQTPSDHVPVWCDLRF